MRWDSAADSNDAAGHDEPGASETATLLFVGDVSFGRDIAEFALQTPVQTDSTAVSEINGTYNFDHVFARTRQYIEDAVCDPSS